MNEQITPPIPPVEEEKRWHPPLPGHPNWTMGTEFVAVYYPLSVWPLTRSFIKSLLFRPLSCALFLACILGVALFFPQHPNWAGLSVLLWLLAQRLWQFRYLWTEEKSLLVFDKLKLWKFNPIEFFPFTWETAFFIMNWSGDVLFVFWHRADVIPRDAFKSREEAREFVAIIRELKQSNGAAWRPEWNGLIFGAQPDDGEAFSIPR